MIDVNSQEVCTIGSSMYKYRSIDFGQLSMNFNHAYKAYGLVSVNDKESYLILTPKILHRGKNAWMQIVIELWLDAIIVRTPLE